MRSPLNHELRQQLRQAIDQHARQRISTPVTSQGTCINCETPHDTYTVGCDTCTNRRWNRTRRKNASYRTAEAEKQRRKRRKVSCDTPATIQSPTEGAARASRR